MKKLFCLHVSWNKSLSNEISQLCIRFIYNNKHIYSDKKAILIWLWHRAVWYIYIYIYMCGYFILKLPSSDILVGIYKTTALLLRRQVLHPTHGRKKPIPSSDRLADWDTPKICLNRANILRKKQSVAQREHHRSQKYKNIAELARTEV
jgi:hypothetical protein